MNTETLLKRAKELEEAGAVRIAVWVHYDSETGYVWPQVYDTEKKAYLDEKLNYPVKSLRLVSDPISSTDPHWVSGSFGTVIPASRTLQPVLREMVEKMREALEDISLASETVSNQLAGVFIDAGHKDRASKALADADALAAKVGEI